MKLPELSKQEKEGARKELRGPKSKANKFGKFRRKDSGEHGQKESLPILRQ